MLHERCRNSRTNPTLENLSIKLTLRQLTEFEGKDETNVFVYMLWQCH